MPTIILGSTSIFKKQLLSKLNLSFQQASPRINEFPISNENPKQMASRLAFEKARAVAKQSTTAIVIASDQTATFNNQPIGKPLSVENAVKQLKQFSNNIITFYTGLVVINSKTQKIYEAMDITKVHFRDLSEQTIHNYINIEQPLQCTGSFKSEGLGITLFEKIESNDPNALIGLPLIELTSIFKQMGYILPIAPMLEVHNKID